MVRPVARSTGALRSDARSGRVADIPRQGEFIVLTFDPQSGHEQRGRRPAMVVSKELFNRRSGFCIVCPITSTDRAYRFHVPVPEGSSVAGYIMVEQVKSIDFRARKAKRIGTAPAATVDEVLALLDACIY